MKKTLTLFVVASLFSMNLAAAYIVVLKNGTQYKAKAKWTMQNGRAVITLENGQTLTLDPALIDEAKSEETTRLGLGNAKIVDLSPNMPQGETTTAKPSLGSQIKLRKLPSQQTPAPTTPTPSTPAPATAGSPAGTTPTPVPATSFGKLPQDVVDKFARAYDNVGIYEQKLESNAPGVLRAELTTDSEDKVFNAISATSFLLVRNAGSSTQIQMVELFLKMTNGGAAGRFQMTREDAQAIDAKTLKVQDYFVRKVLY